VNLQRGLNKDAYREELFVAVNFYFILSFFTFFVSVWFHLVVWFLFLKGFLCFFYKVLLCFGVFYCVYFVVLWFCYFCLFVFELVFFVGCLLIMKHQRDKYKKTCLRLPSINCQLSTKALINA